MVAYLKEKYNRLTEKQKILAEGIFVLFILGFFVFAAFFQPLMWDWGSVQWDAENVHLFNLQYSSSLLSNGEIPLWTPHIFWGYPQIADPQVGLFYPFNLLTSLFTEYTADILLYQTVLNYILAGFFMWLLVRYLTRHFWIALFAGGVYMFSGFMVGHASHIGMMTSGAWLPLIFLLTILALRKLNFKMAVFAGFVSGIMVLAGHFQAALYIAFFVAAYVLYDFFRDKLKKGEFEFKKLGILGIIGLVAFFIAGVQILPTYELQANSYRESVPLVVAQQESLSPNTLWNFINPNHQNVLRHTYSGPHDITQNYVYLGILMPFLVLGGIIFSRKRKYKLFFIFAGGLTLLYAFGSHFSYVHEFFWSYIPLFDKVRAPANSVILLHFSMVMLAVLFLWQLKERFSAKIFTVLSCIIALFAIADVAAFASSGVLLHSIEARQPPDEYVLEESLQEKTPDNYDPGRTLWIHRDEARGNVPQISGIYSADGYNPLTLKRHRELYKFIGENQNFIDMANVRYAPCTILENEKIIEDIEYIHSEKICENENAFPYAYFLSSYENAGKIENIGNFTEFNFRQKVLLEESVKNNNLEGFAPGREPQEEFGSVDILEREAGEIKLFTDRQEDGFVVVTESYYPGWQAHVNGEKREVMRGNYIFMAIPVEAGANEITLSYESRNLKYGAALSLVGLFIVIFVFIYSEKVPGIRRLRRFVEKFL